MKLRLAKKWFTTVPHVISKEQFQKAFMRGCKGPHGGVRIERWHKSWARKVMKTKGNHRRHP